MASVGGSDEESWTDPLSSRVAGNKTKNKTKNNQNTMRCNKSNSGRGDVRFSEEVQFQVSRIFHDVILSHSNKLPLFLTTMNPYRDSFKSILGSKKESFWTINNSCVSQGLQKRATRQPCPALSYLQKWQCRQPQPGQTRWVATGTAVVRDSTF